MGHRIQTKKQPSPHVRSLNRYLISDTLLMMVHSEYSLQAHNTFGFDVRARWFAAPGTVDALRTLLADERYKPLPLLILGGGSNLVFCDNFDGLVVQPRIMGMEQIAADAEFVYVRVGAGVVWDDFVAWTVRNHWGGAENLSFIPGHTGAAPVQNIGAYGAEAGDIIHQVVCLHAATGEPHVFSTDDCRFGYRDSAFKHEGREEMVVTQVVFRLRLHPVLQRQYGNVAEELRRYPSVSLQTMRQAIISIRRRKLPDPAVTGNAGSFFKNPLVPQALAEALLAKDPQMTTYAAPDGFVKLPAARLIEKAGWKGRRMGSVGVHEHQPLVLVNYGGATGHEIVALAEAIRQSVYEAFGVRLEREVIYIGARLCDLTIN
jgi:UDP-N-acetylmuramate dehydrogenase